MKHLLIGLATVTAFGLPPLCGTATAQSAGGAAPPGSTNLAEREAKMFSRSAGYERYMGRWSRLLVPGYIAFAGVRNGDRVVDVGTGTGAVAAAVAAAMPASEIVGVDPAEAFISYAQKNISSSHVRFEVGDAQSLRFPDASFDQTTALLVMNFVPDPEKALREMRRVTRPEGVISACVWDYDAGMEMIRFFWDEVVALEPSMAVKDQRNMKFARRGELGELWRKVGLVNVGEKPLVIEQRFASFDDYWQPFLGQTGAAGAFVAGLSEERRGQLETRLRRRVLGDREDGPFVLTARAWCVRGQVE
jgi:SAM-dependent methyltransferase